MARRDRDGAGPADDPDVIVTHLGRSYTGVSATTEALLALQAQRYRLWLAGRPLPGGFPCHRLSEALRVSRRPPPGRPFRIWHVRRNNELQAAWLARDVLRRPIRIVFTSSAIRRHSPWPRFLISRADAVIATSAPAAALVPKVAAVVPHGVDIRRFHPAEDRAAAWAASGLPGRLGIGIAGRVRPEKGTDLFVEALLRVLPQHPEVTAVILGAAKPGDRAFQDTLIARARGAGLGERIRFVGEVPQADMPSWYRRLSVVVAAGRYEGFGMTVLEAMASGCAAVATRTGAYEQMIDEGRSGWTVPTGDAGALAGALGMLLDEPGAIERFGAEGRRRATTMFSVEHEAAGIAAVYERLWAGETFAAGLGLRAALPGGAR